MNYILYYLYSSLYKILFLGLKFWRCPSRKVYAIPVIPSKRKLVDSSDDSDVGGSTSEKKFSKQLKELNMLKGAVTNVQEELSECHNILKEVVEISKPIPIPLPLMKLTKDAFKCSVCLSFPITPPVIATTCCETIIGCSKCINNWYSGDDGLDKSCPKCRGQRGYAHTFQLKGIDDFLVGIKKMLDITET